eukprot:6490264-Amphidinium_carterae.5
MGKGRRVEMTLKLKVAVEILSGNDLPSKVHCNIINLSADRQPYKLCSVLCHIGETPQHGHYIAYVRNGDTWLCYNDSSVTSVSEAEIGRFCNRPGERSYILFYEKVPRDAVPSTPPPPLPPPRNPPSPGDEEPRKPPVKKESTQQEYIVRRRIRVKTPSEEGRADRVASADKGGSCGEKAIARQDGCG